MKRERARNHLQTGISTTEACHLTGLTYRVLDYWVRVHAVVPTEPSYSSGIPRIWSEDDVEILRALAYVQQDLTELDIPGMPSDLVKRLWKELQRSPVAHIQTGTVTIKVERAS